MMNHIEIRFIALIKVGIFPKLNIKMKEKINGVKFPILLYLDFLVIGVMLKNLIS